jgi:uncharacterized membrane protein
MTSASIKLPRRPRDILVLAVILIIFGLGEIWVGFFGNYLGILSKSIPPSVSTAIVGFFYCLGGLMLLITRRPWGTTLSLIFIGCEVLGRAYLVAIGVAPARGPDLVKIVIGGLIAVGFMVYIGLRTLASRRAKSSDPQSR